MRTVLRAFREFVEDMAEYVEDMGPVYIVVTALIILVQTALFITGAFVLQHFIRKYW